MWYSCSVGVNCDILLRQGSFCRLPAGRSHGGCDLNGCQAARSGGKIVFKGLYSGLAGNLAGVLPSVTSRTLSFWLCRLTFFSSVLFLYAICHGIWLFKEDMNNGSVVCLLWWMYQCINASS